MSAVVVILILVYVAVELTGTVTFQRWLDEHEKGRK